MYMYQTTMSSAPLVADVSTQGIVNIILGTLLIVSEVLAMIPKSPYRGVMQACGSLITKMMADERSIRTRSKSGGQDQQEQQQQASTNHQTVHVNSA